MRWGAINSVNVPIRWEYLAIISGEVQARKSRVKRKTPSAILQGFTPAKMSATFSIQNTVKETVNPNFSVLNK